MTAPEDSQQKPGAGRELPDIIDSSTDGERPSVTDVNGTIARFDMSYEPPKTDRVKFGPPMSARIPSLLYMGFAAVVAAVVTAGYLGSPGQRLFEWVVEGDRGRPLSASVLATIVVVSGIATLIRTEMRGVVVSTDWIEARYLLAMGIPKSRRWGWPQVNRIILDRDAIAFEFYDGGYERLPPVADPKKLRNHLLYFAAHRKIQVTQLES